MTPDTYLRCAVTPALSLLPAQMDSVPARAMLVAIALQESNLEHRAQIGGPARSHLQFEVAGVHGVIRHASSSATLAGFVRDLDYADLTPTQLHAAMEYDGVLAAGIGRLLLWTDAHSLPPDLDGEEAGWLYYQRLWRPGRPHHEKWASCWMRAWEAVS